MWYNVDGPMFGNILRVSEHEWDWAEAMRLSFQKTVAVRVCAGTGYLPVQSKVRESASSWLAFGFKSRHSAFSNRSVLVAEVIEANGGWIVTEPDDKGRSLYVGRDNYWTRVQQAAAAWKDKGEADAFAESLNAARKSRRD